MLRRLAATPIEYVLLWTGLAALTITLLVLLRTRWGQSRPLQKCAVLSLLVHVLLICLSMTVRFVVGDDGSGDGPPIRVRVVDFVEESPAALPAMAIAPPDLLDPPPAPVEPDTPRPNELDAVVAQASESANTTSPAEAPATSANYPTAQPPDANVTPDYNVAATDDRQQTPSTNEHQAPRIEHPASSIEHRASSTPPPTSPYAQRTAADRLRIVEEQGGNQQTEAAVAAALAWLASAQSADGRWDADRFGAGIEQRVLGHDRQGAGRDSDTGISALALLAFLGAGHTHLEGTYQANVERGLEFLLRSQAADGNLFGAADTFAQMYCHGMATFALAEAMAMTGDRRLARGVSAAVAYSQKAQNPTSGGWRYQAGQIGDTSQLGWQMMALASGERAGVNIAPQTWTSIDRFLRTIRRGRFGGLATYQAQQAPASTSMTAEALYCRLLLAEALARSIEEPAAAEATQALLAALPSTQPINLYYWYYATLALHHRQHASNTAQAAWQTWNAALTKTLLDTQVVGGADAGSWGTNTMWGCYGGRVYTTATAAMCLEVYYRYAPAPPAQPGIATRPETLPQPSATK